MKASKFVETIGALGAVFTVKDASRIIGKSEKYASLYLSRLIGSGHVLRIEKGKYCLSNASPYAVASNIVHPSYVSMLAALKYHGLTSQNIYAIDVVTSARHKDIEAMGYSIIFNKVPRRLMFGFYRNDEDNAFVAYPEKALIDALLIGNIPLPYIEEAFENAEANGRLDKSKLMAYAKATGSKALEKKLVRLLNNKEMVRA
ncbi:MAG: type IV toxin-antitoxin system AbiEi family antitoxin domain-containing protein [Candidatus Micrarchaeia archaeon]